MPDLNDPTYLLKKQYRDASNLNARIALHRRFSTSDYNWFLWVFDHFDIPRGARVLELGCGPADLWRKNQHRIPDGWDITLSDFSPGMLEKAQANLADSASRFHFLRIDAQSIPFPDASFDVVIANHMLYHVPDRALAFSEIRRALKPGGRFYATTVGEGHMVELRQWVDRFAGGEAHPWRKENLPAFTLENGAEQLSSWFEDVQLSIFEDGLVITETEPLVAYIRSMSTYRDLTDEICAEIAAFVDEEISACGSVQISKASGLFASRR
jgi:ubiquinone/menaquinone biosynthesis C-methylase UbiE